MSLDPASFELFRRRALGELPAGFALAKALPSGVALADLERLAEADLWAAHAASMEGQRATVLRDGGAARVAAPLVRAGQASLLALKVELARRLLGPCRLCELRCPVDRRAGQVGRCGLGEGLRVYRDYIHLGEEVEIIPTQAIYLAGCSWRCVYCSDWSHVDRPEDDPEVPVERLARSIVARRAEGALSLSFIGGLPDVNLPGILAALAQADASVPVVWNSNLSATPEAHDLIEGVVDAHVADLKYGSEACARPGSGVKGSLDAVHRNLRRVANECYTVVRHLVLPGHVDCCARPALDWLASNTPSARVNLMPQYEPVAEVRGTAWDRHPTASEQAAARAHGLALGLDLEGPGRLPPLARAKPSTGAPPAAGFDSLIRIRDDGTVVFEDLPPDLAAIARDLGGANDDAGPRGDAAGPWLEPQ